MSENKIGKRMVRWSVFLFYCFVVGAVFLLFPIFFYKCPDILFGFDVLLCCVLIIPAVAFGDRLFGWLEKENREQRKKTRLEQEEKSRSVREDFCLPDHIETAFEHDRRIYRRQTIPAIAVGVFGLAVAYGTEVFFSFFKWDELLLTSVFLFGLALIVYAFFVACGKPFLGILHSIAPFLLFVRRPSCAEYLRKRRW